MTDVFKIVNWFRVTSNAEMRTLQADELTQMKVMKLLYYVQGTYLAVHQQKAFANDIIAWRFGPVVREVHDEYLGQRGIVGDLAKDPTAIEDYEAISAYSDLGQILAAVWDTLGDKSATELMKMTHAEEPWLVTPRNGVIDPEVLRTYFLAEVVVQ